MEEFFMSTREMAYNLIDSMTEEQLNSFVSLFKGIINTNTPNEETQKVLNDIENGENLSRTFTSVQELMEDLNADD